MKVLRELGRIASYAVSSGREFYEVITMEPDGVIARPLDEFDDTNLTIPLDTRGKRKGSADGPQADNDTAGNK